VHTVSCAAPRGLGLQKFLPATPVRTLVDVSGKSLGEVLSHGKLNAFCKPLPRNTAQAVTKQIHGEIQQLLAHNNRIAEAPLPAVVEAAKTRLQQELRGESARLRALQQVNPAIRDEEIDFFERQLEAGEAALQKAALQLQALRLVVNA